MTIQKNINAYLVTKNYSNITDEKLKNRFKKTFKFSKNDINQFILLLRKSVSSYDYTDD